MHLWLPVATRGWPATGVCLLACVQSDLSSVPVGWLEPLLDRIAENKSNVVCPVIDVIEDETLKYQYGSAKATSIGGFDWNLQFTWHGIPEYERKRRGNDVAPIRYAVTMRSLQSGTLSPGDPSNQVRFLKETPPIRYILTARSLQSETISLQNRSCKVLSYFMIAAISNAVSLRQSGAGSDVEISLV